jgi:glutathione-regulated potassium-efflux system ancillary protein KefG
MGPQKKIALRRGGASPGATGRVLVLLAHPALHLSRVNRALSRSLEGLEGVTIHDLYEAYPDFDIRVEHEKELLLGHSIIVWQHPFYWYSTPAILKEWQDHVLEYRWAYGPGGHALAGKTLLSAISAGGPASAYTPEGSNRFTMRQLLTPAEQTARLCGMSYLPPFVVHGANHISDADLNEAVATYRKTILSLRDGHLSYERMDDPTRAAENLLPYVRSLREP